jgi:hypothetical protein
MNKLSYLVFLLLALIFLQGCSNNYTELEVKGPPNEKLDIVLVPSHFYGYDPGSNKQWIADAEAIRKRLLEHHFWKNYRDKINMYRLDASITNDFKYSDGIWSPDYETIKELAQTNLPLDFNQNDQIIFVMESVAYEKDAIYGKGHTRGDPNIVTLETNLLHVVVHEFGHSFGRFGEEYGITADSNWKSAPNIATPQPGDTCDDKWKDLYKVVIDAPGTWIAPEVLRDERMVVCYDNTNEGSPVKTFRPTNQACIMRSVGSDEFPFCPVCQRQLVTLLSQYTPYDTIYFQVETFRDPSEFKKATINPLVINFDVVSDLYPKFSLPPDLPQPVFKIDAFLDVLAGRLYAQSGVSFTSGVIFENTHSNASPPNVLGATSLNPLERALIAGYFFSRRICAVGIYNTGSTSVTLRTYNAAFRETGNASVAFKEDAKSFIGIRATEPIYRFEIDAPSAQGFSVDDLSFGECPKWGPLK